MKYPTHGTVAEKSAYLREWGCGGCWRAADEIDKLAAENAKLREALQKALDHAEGDMMAVGHDRDSEARTQAMDGLRTYIAELRTALQGATP